MDLALFEKSAEEGSWLHLKAPGGGAELYTKGTTNPIRIRLAGLNSPRWTRATDNLQNRLIHSKEKDKREVQDMRFDRCTLLAAATLGWEGIEVDGTPLECTPENARQLYIRFKWIADQIDNFVGENENFLPALS